MLDCLAAAAGTRPNTTSLLLVFRLRHDPKLLDEVLRLFDWGTLTLADDDFQGISNNGKWFSDEIVDPLMQLIQCSSNIQGSDQNGSRAADSRILCFSSLLITKGIREEEQLKTARATVAKLDSAEPRPRRLNTKQQQDLDLAQQLIREHLASRNRLIRRWIVKRITPQTEYLLFPVNPTEDHWCTVAVGLKDGPSRGIFYFDPYQHGNVENGCTRFVQLLMQQIANLKPELSGLWSSVRIVSAGQVVEGMSGCNNCGPISVVFSDLFASGMLELGPGGQCSWSSAARALVGCEEVPPLTNAVWPAVRDAMARLFRELMARVRSAMFLYHGHIPIAVLLINWYAGT